MTGHSPRWSPWNGEPVSQVARIYDHVEIEDLRKWIDMLPHLIFKGNQTN